MFFDLKFYSYSASGRHLVARFPFVAKCLIDTVFSDVNDLVNYDVVIVSVVTQRTKILSSDEAVELISERLP